MTPVAAIDQQVYHSGMFPPVRVRTTRASNRPYAEHFHESFSIGVVFRGGTRMRCMDGEFTVRAGEIVFLPPFEPHSCNPIDGQARGYHMFYIDPEWVRQTFLPDGNRFSVRNRVLAEPSFFDAMMALAEAVRVNRPYDRWERCLEDVVQACCSFTVDDTTTEQVPVLDLFVRYGMDAPDETRLAAELGVRRETFIRTFRRATGLPPGQYRQCLRLAEGMRLLGDGASIAHAALQSGFSDQSHFHRMCVKYLSATPAQLRSQSSKT